MSLNEAIKNIVDKQKATNKRKSIPFLTYKDVRGIKLSKLPTTDFIAISKPFEDAMNDEDIQIFIGPRGSGKSLVLRYQEDVFLERYFLEGYKGERILPVWFDVKARGFIAKSSDAYKNSDEFFAALIKRIIEAIAEALKKYSNPNYKEKLKLRSIKKKADGPFEKTHKKKKGKLALTIPSGAGISISGGTVIEFSEEKDFDTQFKLLKKALKVVRKTSQTDKIKIIFEEVSTLTRQESKENKSESDSTLQEWFFDFIDTCRSLVSKGLSISVALLSHKAEFGSDFSDSHGDLVYLDYDVLASFSKVSSQILDTRLNYYTDQKFSDYGILFGGHRNSKAKQLLDIASSGIPRIFMTLSQYCLNARINHPDKYKYITYELVKTVLRGYAKVKQKKLGQNNQALYLSLVKVLSDNNQNKFAFQSDNLGELPSDIRKLVYDLYKQEIIIKKGTYSIFNQAVWWGMVKSDIGFPIKRKLQNTTIIIIDFKNGNFKFGGEKMEDPKEMSMEDEIALEIEKEFAVENSSEELLEDQNYDEILEVDDDLQNLVPTDDLELATDILYPYSQVERLVRKFWGHQFARPTIKYNGFEFWEDQLASDVVGFMQDILKEKSLEIIGELDLFLIAERRVNVKPLFIEEIELQDSLFIDEIYNDEMYERLNGMGVSFLKPGTAHRIVKDVLPNMGFGGPAQKRFLEYLEKWAAILILTIKEVINKLKGDQPRRLLMKYIQYTIDELGLFINEE